MRLKAVIYDISSGGPLIVTLNENTAKELALIPGNRVKISAKGKYIIAALDISKNLKKDEIGILAEANKILNLNKGQLIEIDPEETPKSLSYIKKKLEGHRLTKDEIFSIVDDIVDNLLTEVEIAFFVSGAYTNGFSLDETEDLIKAMALSGDIIHWKNKRVFDKHCIGGVPGNRTSPLIVPILAAAGLNVPKTSSRAITSPSGTADTMEMLTNVEIKSTEEIKRIVKKVGGCLIWGGALNIAPADDKIIRIEKPLSLDPTAMLLSSILAKKYAIGATDVLIDIPYGRYGKVTSPARYKELSSKFIKLGKRLRMNVQVIKTSAEQPIGNGLGPILEARDIMWVLEGDDRAPEDLKEKAIKLSGRLLEMSKTVNKGRGNELARKLLESGRALRKMREIIKIQGGNSKISSKDLKPGNYSYTFKAQRSGKVYMLLKGGLSISKLAGAPESNGAGIYLHKKLGDTVEEGESLFTIYSECQRKLDEAKHYAIDNFPIEIK